MSTAGLCMDLVLPWSWRPLAAGQSDRLWAHTGRLLRVVNLSEGQTVRELATDAAHARLEAKLDLLLTLLAETLQPTVAPTSATLSLSTDGCSLPLQGNWQAGDGGVLQLYLAPALALPAQLPSRIRGLDQGRAQLHWPDMPAEVREQWEQWLFRQHRRSVQEHRRQG
ncbi:MAG: PilZ domain-containing protein [Thiobacillaceae bacterium]|nr:PilZ domain-containing protein [Thiobacillaceae bacterium]MDW8323653.1 PilZ domain-containing protein [Burkholderiales bacterium]